MQFSNRFTSYEQQESQEFFFYMLDGSHKHLNRKPITLNIASAGDSNKLDEVIIFLKIDSKVYKSI